MSAYFDLKESFMFTLKLASSFSIRSALIWTIALLTLSLTAAAAAPTVKTKSITATTVTLSWTPVSGADGYVVIRSLKNVTAEDAVTVDASNATTFTSDGLTPGTLYFFGVRPYVKTTLLPDATGRLEVKTLLTDAVPPPTQVIAQVAPTIQAAAPSASQSVPGPKRSLNPGVAPVVTTTVSGLQFACPAEYTLKIVNNQLTCERPNSTVLAAYARSCSAGGQTLKIVAGTDYCVDDIKGTKMSVADCPAHYVPTVEYSERTDACVYYGMDYRIPTTK